MRSYSTHNTNWDAKAAAEEILRREAEFEKRRNACRKAIETEVRTAKDAENKKREEAKNLKRAQVVLTLGCLNAPEAGILPEVKAELLEVYEKNHTEPKSFGLMVAQILSDAIFKVGYFKED